MLQLDTATYLITQDDPAGPIVQFVDDGVEPHGLITRADGSVSKASASAYVLTYGLLAAFVGYLFIAL